MTEKTDNAPDQYLKDPTLSELLHSFWMAKFYIITSGIIGLILATIFLSSSIPQYRSSILVSPAERSKGVDLQALVPQTSSFAIQKLVNSIAPQDTTDFVRFNHILRGPSIATILLSHIESDEILKPIEDHKRFVFSSGAGNLDSIEKLSAYLEDNIKIQPVGNTALRRIIYDHHDPKFAQDFLMLIYKKADNLIKEDNRQATDMRIEYLEDALTEVRNADHRRAITSLLMEQEHSKMILQIDEPYAAKLVEQAAVGYKPHWPNKTLIYSFFMLLSGMIGYVIYSLQRFSKMHN